MDCKMLVEQLPQGMKMSFGEPLSRHTGYKTGGPADLMVWPESRDALLETVGVVRKLAIPFFILGNGSNVLALDEGYRGVVIKTERALCALGRSGDIVRCGAGVSLGLLCDYCQKRGLQGLEFAFGIPGTVGGALFMNAGAYGGEIKDVAVFAEVLMPDGAVRTLSGEELSFGYRTSALQSLGAVVLEAGFRLTAGEQEDIRARMAELMARRREKQPLDLPSCGSTFKRPQGTYAAKLIEDCGLKGFSVGGAAVSEKHSGFVVNKGGATSEDILGLVREVQQQVWHKTGVRLALEIQILR